MRILDRYIVKNVASGYLFILVVFIGLYFVIDMFINLADILQTRPSVLVLAQYYFYSLPLILMRVSPFSLLIATLYCFGDLNKNNELMSVRTAGTSIVRIAMPVLVLTSLICVSILFMQEKLLIQSQQQVESIKSQFVKNKLTKGEEEKNLAFTSGNMIFFVGSFSPEQKIMRNVKIFTRDSRGNLIKQSLCTYIAYEYGFWIARDLIEYSLDVTGKINDVAVRVNSRKIDLKEKPEDLLLKKSIFLEFSSLSTLRKEIAGLKKIGSSEKIIQLIVSYHQKIAEPFMHLFLVLGVLPVAFEIRKRKVALSSLGVGFIFFFVYVVLSSFCLALGKSGMLLPLLSAWVAPLFFLAVGVTGLILVK